MCCGGLFKEKSSSCAGNGAAHRHFLKILNRKSTEYELQVLRKEHQLICPTNQVQDDNRTASFCNMFCFGSFTALLQPFKLFDTTVKRAPITTSQITPI